jgi:hypothetical protein
VVVIDGRYFSKVTRADVEKLIAGAREGFEDAEGGGASVFPIDVSCPRCNHTLMDDTFSIEGRPSIRVTLASDGKHGWLRLSSIYGRYNVFSEHEVEPDTMAHLFCPHCHAELTSTWDCPTCGAPMASLIVRGGGVVRICTRRGCCGSRSHMLDLL